MTKQKQEILEKLVKDFNEKWNAINDLINEPSDDSNSDEDWDGLLIKLKEEMAFCRQKISNYLNSIT